jgi:hypothetical protein
MMIGADQEKARMGTTLGVPSATSEATCPYCGQPISRKEFREIQVRIEIEERARIGKVEQIVPPFCLRKASAINLSYIDAN